MHSILEKGTYGYIERFKRYELIKTVVWAIFIALIIGIGAIFLLGFLATKISGLLGVDLLAALNSLPDVSAGMLAGCAIGVTALILLGSALLSIRIVQHKEF